MKAPRTRRALAVKIQVEDVESWVSARLLRNVTGIRVTAEPPDCGRVTRSRASCPNGARDGLERRGQASGRRMASWGTPRAMRHAEGEPLTASHTRLQRLTPSSSDDPFAFLLAVVFDQGIAYGRAWQAPLELRRRLGTIEPADTAGRPRRPCVQP